MAKRVEADDEMLSPTLQVQADAASILGPHFASDGLVVRCLEYASRQLAAEHGMDLTRLCALGSLISMLRQATYRVLQYNNLHSDFPMLSDWQLKVPQIEVEAHKDAAPDAVVSRTQTTRSLRTARIRQNDDFVQCASSFARHGGRRIELFAYRHPRTIPLKKFDHYCEYRKTPNGVVLSPIQLDKWPDRALLRRDQSAGH